MAHHHTVSSYDQELQQLTTDILAMGKLVLEIIEIARKALVEPREDYVALAKETDKKINALDKDIEKQATEMIALRNPVAIDLRLVTSALKASTILERMGDIAKSNTKRVANVTITLEKSALQEFDKVARVVEEMIEDILDAYQQQDAEKAIAVWERDDEVDAIYNALFETLQQTMMSDSAKIPSCIHIMFAAKNFERLGDFATNLAQLVYYIVSGKRVNKVAKAKKAVAGL